MARLGLDLNLGLQSLLAANKNRASANRAELEERKRREAKAKEEQDKLAKREGPRSSVPDLYRPDEPAAQRNPKTGLEVYGVGFVDKRQVSGSQVVYSQGWTGYRLDYAYDYTNTPSTLISSSTANYTGANQFTTQASKWAPLFSQQLTSGTRDWQAPAHTVSLDLDAIDWTFRQKSLGLTGGFSHLETKASIPDVPFSFSGYVVVDEKPRYASSSARPVPAVDRTFTSCDGTYVYHSRLIRTRAPLPVMFAGQLGATDSLFDADNYETYKFNMVPRPGKQEEYRDSEAYSRRFIRDHPAYGRIFWRETAPALDRGSYSLDSWTGLYWKFNARTKQPVSFRTGAVGTMENRALDPALSAAAALFFASLDSTDPIYKLWQDHRGLYPGYSDVNLLDEWFKAGSVLQRWPGGLTYDVGRSMLTLVTIPQGTNTRRIFSKPVPAPPAAYSSIPALHLPPGYIEPLTSISDYLANGWKDEGPMPGSSSGSLDQYFALVP